MVELNEDQCAAIVQLVDEATSSNWPIIKAMIEETGIKDDLVEAMELLSKQAGVGNPIPADEFE